MLKNPGLRLGAVLWLAGMTGVIALSLTVIPQILEKTPQPIPPSVAVAASVVQSGLFLALAVWAGVALSRSLGLGAPAVEAALSGSRVWPVLKRQLGPAAMAGLIVGGMPLLVGRIAPAELLALNQVVEIPVVAKLLYGGVTEELLMRWGLMTVLIWLPWRLLQKGAGLPRIPYVAVAILVAALLFGVLHLPAVVAMGASLTAPVVGYVVVGNTVPGILFGFLYWRYGIEAAILAHAFGHAVASVAAAAA